MADSPQKSAPDNEQRYMALLALTSQELPKPRSRQLEDTEVNKLAAEQESLFLRLDADPATLDAYLQRERRSIPQSTLDAASSPTISSVMARLVERMSTFLSPASVRYAAALGVAAVISVLVLSQLPRGESLSAFVEQSYNGLALYPTQSSLVLPWERPPAALGFGPNADNNSVAANEFAQGLLRGKQLLVSGQSLDSGKSSAKVESAYAALGEWNVLLWAASESTPPRTQSFWVTQQAIYEKFSAASFDHESGQIVGAHLARVRGIIDTLAAEQSPARNARALADELLLFREQFAPRDAAVVNGRTPSTK